MSSQQWPRDVDGDVFRRMADSGFDFTSEHVIDFNIDMEQWPPAPALIAEVERRYPDAQRFGPEGQGDRGYVQIQVRALLTYELVMTVQREMSELARPFGGICESWGVMQHP